MSKDQRAMRAYPITGYPINDLWCINKRNKLFHLFCCCIAYSSFNCSQEKHFSLGINSSVSRPSAGKKFIHFLHRLAGKSFPLSGNVVASFRAKVRQASSWTFAFTYILRAEQYLYSSSEWSLLWYWRYNGRNSFQLFVLGAWHMSSLVLTSAATFCSCCCKHDLSEGNRWQH